MKNLILIISVLFINYPTYAQSPKWQWAKADTNAKITISPGYAKHIIAASNDKLLWGVIQNNKMVYGQSVLGDYKLTVYDSTGTALTSTMITGKFTLIDAQADNFGNWYFLGQYYDTVNFPGGLQFTRNPFGSTPEYFMFSLSKSSFSLRWAQHIGTDNNSTVNAFTIANNTIYMAVDSGASATIVRKADLTNGTFVTLFTQTGQSIVSSIAVDDKSNIYLAGSCAFTAINFNGHVGTSPSGYPVYIVRYKANGTYDWSYFMNDVTCVFRKLNIADNNNIYYTGTIHDTLSLAGIDFHHPAWLYDLMIVKLDSAGHIGWTKQLKDTASGDADVEFPDHAVVGPDGSINILAETRKYVDWGNGVVTNIHGYVTNVSVINISSAGIANWARITNADYTSGQHIAATSNGIWITGNGYDSTSLQFDSVEVPVPHNFIPYLAKIGTSTFTAVNTVNNTTPIITLAPNPANSYISVIGLSADETTTIRITDIRGSKVFERTYSHTQQQALNVSGYSRGLYFVEIIGKGYKTVQKLILQ